MRGERVSIPEPFSPIPRIGTTEFTERRGGGGRGLGIEGTSIGLRVVAVVAGQTTAGILALDDPIRVFSVPSVSVAPVDSVVGSPPKRSAI